MRSRVLRVLRVFVTVATFVVVWLVASPARAAAPVCDPRGAITFAPPPQIQDAEQSLDVPDIDCVNGEAGDDARHVVPHRAASSIELSSPDQTTTTPVPLVPDPSGERVDAPPHTLPYAPSGVRSSVERPPRG